ncbi:MAG: hypothetical protein WBW33_06605, partial [Bryobacteraceae bacterium]
MSRLVFAMLLDNLECPAKRSRDREGADMARRATKLDEDASSSSTDLSMSAGVHTPAMMKTDADRGQAPVSQGAHTSPYRVTEA